MENTVTLKNYYVMIRNGNHVAHGSIAAYKSQCIRNFISPTAMTWNECKKYGWRCEKVTITFNKQQNESI